MSKMNQLDLCISDIANGDKDLERQIRDEMELHLNGLLHYSELCESSQKAICAFEQANKAEMDYNSGRLGMPEEDE